MKTITKRLLTLLLGTGMAGIAMPQAYQDIYPDTWVATDGVGRVMPTSEDVPLKTDKESSTLPGTRRICITERNTVLM